MGLAAFVSVALASAVAVQAKGAGTSLDPVQPVILPDGAHAKNPLAHLGGNGPWTVGPDVHGIPSDVPENCVVDQAAYVLRHGSRYVDNGAHNGWLDMAERFNQSTYKATGPMAFVHNWKSPVQDPSKQIAMLSQTGYKELHDLGYTLRTRYPDLYTEGDDFVVWANNYTRCIQTAQGFVRGYLGANSSSVGRVVSVTGRGFPSQLGNTLAPSDMCPTFVDDSSEKTNVWRDKWLPKFIERLSKHIEGDLVLETGSWNDFPYVCGFESQITGSMSPFCDTFTQEELEAYEYQQDLRYYYGVGPGTDVASKMMVPFLDSLLQRFIDGPGGEGIDVDGSSFKIPKLLLGVLNDGQLNELAVAVGVFDEQEPLPTDHIAKDRLWVNSRISPMRGTVALERLTCRVKDSDKPSHPHEKKPTAPGCDTKEETFVRIRLNEAVYPVPSCQDGPGKSCRLDKYADYVANKLEKNGNFAKVCNATDPETPTKVQGASFFTDLSLPHLQIVTP